jgi:hypothetical protein
MKNTSCIVKENNLIDPIKIKIVKRMLKAENEGDAINKAMDILIENSKIEKTHSAIKGKDKIEDIYGTS